jgi:hypothetical protein
MHFFLFAATLVQLTSSCFARYYQWKSLPGTNVKYGNDCKISGMDITTFMGTWDQCAFACHNTPLCSKFMWLNNMCSLKYGALEFMEPDMLRNSNSVCGIIQYDGTRQWTSEGFIDWSTNCDSKGVPFKSIPTPWDQCSKMCKDNFDCRAFTWVAGYMGVGGMCHLKDKSSFKSDIFSVGGNTICGIK